MFTAVRPPEDVVEALDDFLEPRRESGPWRWALPESWHLTLAFMADVPDRSLDDLVARLSRAAAKRTPFELRLAGGGAFPNPARARVLYAAVAADPEAGTELDRLATGCRAAAAKAGAPPEGAAFRPHVTLGRVSRPVEATRWLRVLEAFGSRTWVVDRVELVASYLGQGPRNRPRHEVVDTMPLGRAGSSTASNVDETTRG
jgi:RNA 2',3'-cyclic 3'-phosphodiesterase